MTVNEKVLAAFYEIITESKQEMFDRIASDRTRHVVVAMENIRKDHNASAVLRTCDCFGVQDLYTIEKEKHYTIQREIARGAGNWVDLHSFDSTTPTMDCLSKLKSDGYKIVATSPHAEKDIHSIDIDKPMAIFFGTEWHGISEEVIQNSDELVKIPMYGFTESFNISVSVAIILNILRHRLSESDITWKISHDEQVKLKIDWCTKIVKDGDRVEQEIRRRILEKE